MPVVLRWLLIEMVFMRILRHPRFRRRLGDRVLAVTSQYTRQLGRRSPRAIGLISPTGGYPLPMTHPSIRTWTDQLPSGTLRLALRVVAVAGGSALWILAVLGALLGAISGFALAGLTHSEQTGLFITVGVLTLVVGAVGTLLVWWGAVRKGCAS